MISLTETKGGHEIELHVDDGFRHRIYLSDDDARGVRRFLF